MSKLVELLSGSAYARLSALPAGPLMGGGANAQQKSYSVRNQSGGSQASKTVIQGNAVDFFDNKMQRGFNTFKEGLSTTGFRKASTNNSDFTGTPGTLTSEANKLTAFDTYYRNVELSDRTSVNGTATGRQIHIYKATNTLSTYLSRFSSSKGIQLIYTPA